jgi:hypothetical protein
MPISRLYLALAGGLPLNDSLSMFHRLTRGSLAAVTQSFTARLGAFASDPSWPCYSASGRPGRATTSRDDRNRISRPDVARRALLGREGSICVASSVLFCSS